MPSFAQPAIPAVPDRSARPVPQRAAPPSGDAGRSTLLALERALAAQDEELELAFAAFRDLARSRGGLRLPDEEWSSLTEALTCVNAPRCPGVQGATGAVQTAGNRC